MTRVTESQITKFTSIFNTSWENQATLQTEAADDSWTNEQEILGNEELYKLQNKIAT